MLRSSPSNPSALMGVPLRFTPRHSGVRYGAVDLPSTIADTIASCDAKMLSRASSESGLPDAGSFTHPVERIESRTKKRAFM
jgi:hypothetical protein